MGGVGGGKSPALYWQAVYSDKAKAGKATGDVLLNEFGVMMFSNSGGFMQEWGGKKSELPDEATTETVDGGLGLALRFEVVHRARSAAEGVKIAATLIDRYGYGPDARTFTIADRDEAWIFCQKTSSRLGWKANAAHLISPPRIRAYARSTIPRRNTGFSNSTALRRA